MSAAYQCQWCGQMHAANTVCPRVKRIEYEYVESIQDNTKEEKRVKAVEFFSPDEWTVP